MLDVSPSSIYVSYLEEYCLCSWVIDSFDQCTYSFTFISQPLKAVPVVFSYIASDRAGKWPDGRNNLSALYLGNCQV